jgi:hypothetical protein
MAIARNIKRGETYIKSIIEDRRLENGDWGNGLLLEL